MSDTTALSKNYSIKTGLTTGGQGFVTIWEQVDGTPAQLIWKFIPNRNNPKISFAEFSGENELLTMDCNGRISLFDLKSREKVKELALDAKGEAGAVLDRDHNFLFMTALSRADGEKYFYQLDLNTWKIEGKLKLTTYAVTDHLWILDDRHVLVYFRNGGSFSSEEGDGLYKINYRNLLVSAKCFSGPCFSRFEIPPLAIDPARNVGVRPYFDRTEVKKTQEGYRYGIKIQFFKPDTCRTIRNVVVREFHPEHVFEDIDPTSALEILEDPDSSDDYRDIRDEFLERIDSLVLCYQEDAAWVAFQHGLIRKVSFDGKLLSPLVGHPGDETLNSDDPFIRTKHDNPILISKDDHKITFGTPAISIDPKIVKDEWEGELVILEKGQVSFKENLIDPKGEDFSKIDIPVASFTDEVKLKEVLENLIDKSNDIDTHRDGNLWNLNFIFEGERYTERQFFKQVMGKEALYPLIERYILNLIQYPSVLWESDYTPVGFSGIEVLVKSKLAYLPLFNRYLSSGLIDGEKEDDRITHLITAIISKYGWLVQTIDMILIRATYQNNKGLDQLQFLLESTELRQYLSEEKHRRYFRRHEMFKALAEEYFHILMPAESKLYDAIVAEDVSGIKKILSDYVDLEIKHPEFNCFALELALDVENPAILDLLLLHHQNIQDQSLAKLYFCLANRKRKFSPFEQKQVDKAIYELSKKRGEIINQLSEMGFDELVTYQIGEKQMEKMGKLNQQMEEINLELRFARLGLSKDGEPLFFLNHTTERYDELEKSDRDTQTIETMKSGFHRNIIHVKDLRTENGQLEALKALVEKGEELEEYIQGKYLSFTFEDDRSAMTEEEFFEELDLTPEVAQLILQYIKIISTTAGRELWYDDVVQSGMYMLQALVLFDKRYITDFIQYLESPVVNTEEEQDYPNEIIYQLLDQYGWCEAMARVILARSISCMGPCAMEEFRFWFKKGGLRVYLQEAEHLNLFYQLLEQMGDVPEKTDWIKTFLLEQLG